MRARACVQGARLHFRQPLFTSGVARQRDRSASAFGPGAVLEAAAAAVVGARGTGYGYGRFGAGDRLA